MQSMEVDGFHGFKRVVDSFRLIRDVNTGKSIGVLYVKLKNENDMETVMKRAFMLRGTEVSSNTLFAFLFALSRREHFRAVRIIKYVCFVWRVGCRFVSNLSQSFSSMPLA